MYYDTVKSGERIHKMREAAGITRDKLADILEITPDAMRKIERGRNGAKIDTLILLADYFHVTLDYLVCGIKQRNDMEGILEGLSEMELLFIQNMVKAAVANMELLRK